MTFSQRLRLLPKSVYAIGQLGLLGLPSVLFIPLLLRWVDVDVVATLLVAQVYVYYLVMLQQFSFNLTGPARLVAAANVEDRGILSDTLRFKSVLFLFNVLVWGAIVYSVFDGASALLVFLALLLSYVFNSSWYLQSRHDFYTGALSAGLGVAGGLAVLLGIWQSKRHGLELNGVLGWAVLAMIAPQTIVGIGTFWRATRLTACPTGVGNWPVKDIWPQGCPLMISQLLLLATTTLGTVVVGHMADSDVTAAYAATEKMFNLVATVLVALYAVHYPQLALEFRADLAGYWHRMWRVNGRIAAWGLVALLLMAVAGESLLGIYLGKDLAKLVSFVLVPMAVWLTLVPLQNALQCHLAISGKASRSIGVACLMLAVELLIGGSLMVINPLYWVYGMVAAQLPPVLLLIRLYQLDVRTGKAG